MAKEEKKVAEETEQASEQEQTTIRWDGSKMRSTYSNVCNVSSSREEVTIMFGTNQNWHAGQQELTIELSDRMTLNPHAAKRLSVLLANTMDEYEKRFGELPLEVAGKKAE
jgi:GTP cyclohydrolase FolE2